MGASELTSKLNSRLDALIVFAKPPASGEVKTRLTTLITPEEAAKLYEAFLQDILAAYEPLDVAVRVYVTPPIDAFPRDLLPEHATLHEQRGEGLGRRMCRAFKETIAAGYERAVIIGTDHPTLPQSIIIRTFNVLGSADGQRSIPIGPSRDGGYYLLGMRRVYESLFDMNYSHSSVFEQTSARITEEGLTPVVLPEWYDVDDPADLVRLAGDLHNHSDRAPRTYQVVQTLTDRYPSVEMPG